MALPISLIDVNNQIDIELKKYYSMISNNASTDDITKQKELLTELNSLRDSFIDNNEYSIMLSQAESAFNTAKVSLLQTDIDNAFQVYTNLSAYLKTNMINFNENTNTPVFTISNNLLPSTMDN